MQAARNGDQMAAETLTMRDMKLYSQINRELYQKDIYSIVETYFMPNGVECDLYSILGYITSLKCCSNLLSGEVLYVMEIICNEIPVRLVINAEDLTGVPAVGYRFKGDIWLQGRGIWNVHGRSPAKCL